MKHTALTTTLLLMALCLISSAASASTWYVNGVSGSDSNNCTSATTACKTIGHAISLAASGDTIKVAAAIYTENLTINKSVRVSGASATKTVIDGGGTAGVVTISSGIAVTLTGLTIRNGLANAGAGILNSGNLLLIRSTVTGNAAKNFCNRHKSCGSAGGGIYNEASLTIKSSTISGNSAFTPCEQPCGASAFGGGIANDGTLNVINSTITANEASADTHSGGGGISNGGTLEISNSTISGNSAPSINGSVSVGGGISNGGTLEISNSTISGNSAPSGGGGNISGGGTLKNSIVSNATSGGNCTGTIISNGYNLSSDATCAFSGPGDMNSTDPMLGPLQYNGGPTQTMALPSGSPAVDAGNPSGCTDNLGHLLKTDQRGKPRPDTEDTGGCDMGAYERQSD